MSVKGGIPGQTAEGGTRKAESVFKAGDARYTLGHLYEQGRISAGLGAQVLGCDRLEFSAC